MSATAPAPAYTADERALGLRLWAIGAEAQAEFRRAENRAVNAAMRFDDLAADQQVAWFAIARHVSQNGEALLGRRFGGDA